MVKLIITIAVIYFAYRFFIVRPALPNRSDRAQRPVEEPPKKDSRGEYVDYEEMD